MGRNRGRAAARAGAAAVAALAAATALAGLLPVTGYGNVLPTARNAADPTGRTEAVGPAAEGPAGAADLSADGRYAAFATDAGLFVRGLDRRTTVAVDTAGARAGAPSLSGDGRLLAYTAVRPEGGPAEHRVVDLAAPGGPVTRLLTGRAGDLDHQRPAACVPACGPQLSDDGRTAVLAARVSLAGAALRVSVLDTSGSLRDLGDVPGALLDFGLTAGPAERVLEVLGLGPDPVPVLAPEIASDGSFAVVPEGTSCGGSDGGAALLTPGGSCRVTVRFTPRRCTNLTAIAELRLRSPVPAGQTVLALVGDAAGCGPAVARTDPESALSASSGVGCPAAAPARGGAALRLTARLPGGGEPGAVRIPETTVGDESLVAVPVTNGPTGVGLDLVAGPRTLRFVTSDCSLDLVRPARVPRDAPPPCRAGQVLPPAAGLTTRPVEAGVSLGACTAYLRLRPGAVRPYAATINLEPAHAGGGSARVRIVGAGARDVVLARRDPQGVGDFTGAGRPAAQVVGVGRDGAAVSAHSPAVSPEGRWVAFTARAPAGARGVGQQVYLHDSDAGGDGTFRPGATRLVSLLPHSSGRRALALWAGSPSVSAGGRSVAYEAYARPGTPFAGCGCAQVWVSDVDRGRSVPASLGRHGPGRTDSFSPALAADGSTVAFGTRARDLTSGQVGGRGTGPGGRPVTVRADQGPAPVSGPAPVTAGFAGPDRSEQGAVVLVRDLGPDRGGPGGRRLDRVSPHGLGGAGSARISGDGGRIVFRATGVLRDGVRDVSTQVRMRYGRLVVSPDKLAFGGQAEDSRGPGRQLTLTNVGPGPLLARVRTRGPFTVDDACGRVLHRAESCRVGVVFNPTSKGPADGALQVAVSGDTATAEPVGPGRTADPADHGGARGPAAPAAPRNPAPPAQTGGPAGRGDPAAPPATPAAPTAPAGPVPQPGAEPPASEEIAVALSGTGTDRALEVSESGLALAPAPYAKRGTPVDVTVTNRAKDRMVLTADSFVVRDADGTADPRFVADPGSCATFVLASGESCIFTVLHRPAGAEDARGMVTIVGTVPEKELTHLVTVALTGPTLRPAIEVDPVVLRPGQGFVVTGRHFPPDVTVSLSGLGPGLGPEDVRTDNAGGFRLKAILLRGEEFGPWRMDGRSPVFDLVAGPEVLIVPGSYLPSGGTRR